MAAVSQSSIVISTYRSLAKLVCRLPEKQQSGAWRELREGFRKHTDETSPDRIVTLIEEAGKKIAFLRIVTPKAPTNQTGVSRWVYRSSGEKDADGKATLRKSGQVVSNWNGNNLDPCSVNTHNGQLKRMGFVNNLHAKGLFWFWSHGWLHNPKTLKVKSSFLHLLIHPSDDNDQISSVSTILLWLSVECPGRLPLCFIPQPKCRFLALQVHATRHIDSSSNQHMFYHNKFLIIFPTNIIFTVSQATCLR